MLGNFGIYLQFGSFWFRKSANQRHALRFLLGMQPHEIAALNEGFGEEATAKRSVSRPAEQRQAA